MFRRMVLGYALNKSLNSCERLVGNIKSDLTLAY
jgi:hypothetical protein